MTTTQHIDIDDIDTLATQEVRVVNSRGLREGMILVDELDCPCFVLDHRIGNDRAGVQWLAADLDRGGFRTVSFSTTLTPTIRIAANLRRGE